MYDYAPRPMSPREALEELEATYHLGRPALIVNGALRGTFTVLAIPAIPAGCLLGFVHGCLMVITFGIYALLWTIVWLPFLGVTLGTSWLWAKVPLLWPVWALLGVPFVIVACVLAMLGPQDPGGEDKTQKLGLMNAWPYTYFVMFEKQSPGSERDESEIL